MHISQLVHAAGIAGVQHRLLQPLLHNQSQTLGVHLDTLLDHEDRG